MAQIIDKEFLTFDDVLLLPRPSNILPSDAVLTSTLGEFIFDLPFISAAMDTVTEEKMSIAMAKGGGLGVLHKNMAWGELVAKVRNLQGQKGVLPNLKVAVALSPSWQDINQQVSELVWAGLDIVFIDSAHGGSINVLKTIEAIKKEFPNLPVVGGNVATRECARRLQEAGADAIKVGCGPGSICTTRIVSGTGVPQLSAVMDVADTVKVPVIADGGIRTSGDVVKALAAGASFVMLGGMLAGTDESCGEFVNIDGKPYKKYRGMGSREAMKKGSALRYGHSDTKKATAEGVEGLVPWKGPVSEVLAELSGGLRSGMGYIGALTIAEMRERALFIKITGSGQVESKPHSLASYK